MERMVLKKAVLIAFIAILAGCSVLSPAPPRFPQFGEYSIAGPGNYALPQWSPDSRYLAFADGTLDPILMIYDTETKATWEVANNISKAHFSWSPNGDLTYLKYRPDLSGSPYPIISELHRVNLRGENDTVIAANLSSAGDFVWFSDGERLAILLTEPTSNTYFNDVYLLNTMTGTTNLLLRTQDIDLRSLGMLALSEDEKSILVYGSGEQHGPLSAQIVIYDLETQTVRNRIIPSQIIPAGNTNYPWPGIGDTTNAGWVGRQRWFLTEVNTPGGECYNYALFFLDTRNLHNSFCIPTVVGIVTDPTISPDLSRVSYITVAGPGVDYLMVGNVTPNLLEQLELEPVRND
jgi:hypothetical protein